jgi:hypothetical protein
VGAARVREEPEVDPMVTLKQAVQSLFNGIEEEGWRVQFKQGKFLRLVFENADGEETINWIRAKYFLIWLRGRPEAKT